MIALVVFVWLTGADGGDISVNARHIVNFREPRTTEEQLIRQGVGCLIFTDDGKFTSVREHCATVLTKLKRIKGN